MKEIGIREIIGIDDIRALDLSRSSLYMEVAGVMKV